MENRILPYSEYKDGCGFCLTVNELLQANDQTFEELPEHYKVIIREHMKRVHGIEL